MAAERASAPLLRVGPFFHGGVPGLEIDHLLVSATRIGLRYHYLRPDTPYDPNWVYATTDVGVTEAFAHRNLRGGHRPVPGDVYEVEPGGGAGIDPAYDMFPEVFLRSSWLPDGTPSSAEAAALPAPGRSQPSRHSRTTPPELA